MIDIIIFISGRGSNMKRIIEETQRGILQDKCNVLLVFSDNKQAKGLEIAKNLGIQTAYLSAKGKKREEFDQEVLKVIEKHKFDYLILAGYMRILSTEFVKRFPNKIINIHPADTKLHQGLEAYKWAFEKKLKTTKITVHYVDEGVDTGNIIGQQEVDISTCKTLEEVEQKGLEVEHKFYSQVLYNLSNK